MRPHFPTPLLPLLRTGVLLCLLLNAQSEGLCQPLDLVEVGANDFRISDMGPEGITGLYIDFPSVVWNAVDKKYLAVWEAEDPIGKPTNGDYGIFGQLLSATGVETGTNDFTIKDKNSYYGSYPEVALNPSSDQYLTVWSRDGMQLFGQRIDSLGSEIGINDFQIETTYDSGHPSIAWNASENEYLVVWGVGGRVILGRRLSASGEESGDEFQISDFTPWANAEGAHDPEVVWNDVLDEYLVVWHGYHNSLGPSEFEVFGQRLSSSGMEVGRNDFPISESESGYRSGLPQVLWNADVNEYLVPVAERNFRIICG